MDIKMWNATLDAPGQPKRRRLRNPTHTHMQHPRGALGRRAGSCKDAWAGGARACVRGSRPSFMRSSGCCHQATCTSEAPDTCAEMFRNSAADA